MENVCTLDLFLGNNPLPNEDLTALVKPVIIFSAQVYWRPVLL
jgi:hypothetical protein